jgi:hypothetical protein
VLFPPFSFFLVYYYPNWDAGYALHPAAGIAAFPPVIDERALFCPLHFRSVLLQGNYFSAAGSFDGPGVSGNIIKEVSLSVTDQPSRLLLRLLYNTTIAASEPLRASALTLLVFRILTDDTDAAFSFDNLALIADRLY